MALVCHNRDEHWAGVVISLGLPVFLGAVHPSFFFSFLVAKGKSGLIRDLITSAMITNHSPVKYRSFILYYILLSVCSLLRRSQTYGLSARSR